MAVKIYFKKFNSIYTLYVRRKSHSLRQHSPVTFIYDPCYVSEKQCCTLRGKNGEREYQEKKKNTKTHKLAFSGEKAESVRPLFMGRWWWQPGVSE